MLVAQLRAKYPLQTLAIAVVVVLLVIVSWIRSDSYDRGYYEDPSCNAGFTFSGTPPGACSIVKYRLIGWHAASGKFSLGYTVLVLQSADEKRTELKVDELDSKPMRDGAHRGDRDASAQLYDGKIARLKTNSGEIRTASLPTPIRRHSAVSTFFVIAFAVLVVALVARRSRVLR